MKTSYRLRLLLLALVAALALAPAMNAAKAQEKVKILWFVGIGSGTNEQQIAAEKEVVADFNASQDKIELEINIAPTFETATDTLSTLIAAGTPPDIVGPVGVGGSNQYADQWVDLKPFVEKAKYDLSGLDPALLDLYATANGGYSAIPFGVFPSVVYYSRDLFDEAGLKYPPQAFGDQYEMPDGTKVDWNYDTLATIAKMLTVDANGKTPADAAFDATQIKQFGLTQGYERIRLLWTQLSPAEFYNAETKKVNAPEGWEKGLQWWYDRVWVDHSMPTDSYAQSELFGSGNPFNSGNVAMVISPLWYTCCINDSIGKFEWDMAVVPQSFDGQYHVAMDADTFRMTKDSKHPDEAFTVLTYLLNDAVPKLAPTYGAFPALTKYQQPWIDSKAAQYNWNVKWQVAIDSLSKVIPANMHHESNLPNWSKVYDREFALQTMLLGETGKDMDVKAEFAKFIADVQAITEEK
ncbi:MAG: extracellular solute-binding protein [Anaerolineae bacterium]|nr:extracellular solute-binding protein [Anaerolineae bacterium]